VSISRTDDEEIRRQGKDPARFTNAPEIAQHEDDHESERHLDAVEVPLWKRRRERGNSSCDAHSYGEHVIDQERACGDKRWRFAEVVLRDDVRTAAAWVGVDSLSIGEDYDCQDCRDHEGDRAR
jgi:hypothetical protein